MGWIIFIAILVIVGGYGLSVYNQLVAMREMVGNAKAQIATQIESRWDALSNLMGAVGKYSEHEKETFEKIVQGRQQVSPNSSVEDLEQADAEFTGSLGRLIAVAESYPDLKASTLYQETMQSVNQYEDNVRMSRMTFNDMVTKYNRTIQMVPKNIVANIGGFSKEDYFEGTKEKAEMPMW